ncbi:helix-turn-helix transcriptional regulator [Dietzia timorensis]|uniref:HTH cro/C1-type domain-containing protein n=1 Tax=Dietzia timorensis TaxID=499555 RepID=A0A173LKI8_9ACTN|nr:helix-turn-helix transcriptional regulator [Dietzia timorensis]ANI91222.1 Hypothetical protein BJL86_0412 [Dietzia timorensis]
MPVSDSRLTPQQLRGRDVRRKALAAVLIDSRKAAGLTQAQLAERAGLARSTIITIEQGKAGISSDALWEIAKAVERPLSEIIAAVEADDAAAASLQPDN